MSVISVILDRAISGYFWTTSGRLVITFFLNQVANRLCFLGGMTLAPESRTTSGPEMHRFAQTSREVLMDAPNLGGQLSPSKLQRHVLDTYLTLRIGIAVLAFAFPFLLLLVGKLAGVENPGSMSAYYWAEVNRDGWLSSPRGRVVFVGLLCAIAAFLYLYKGFTKRENVALNLAAFFAVCVAFFPMEMNCTSTDQPAVAGQLYYCFPGINPHGPSAALLFACLAYVMWWRSDDTVKMIKDKTLRSRYRALYRMTSLAMIALPLVAGLFHVFRNDYSTLTFWLEAGGVISFSSYWFIKSFELKRTFADEKAASGVGIPPLDHAPSSSPQLPAV